nr:transposase, MuDR, MULE transposase domain protein [Tanacetum cinerariifolium]
LVAGEAYPQRHVTGETPRMSLGKDVNVVVIEYLISVCVKVLIIGQYVNKMDLSNIEVPRVFVTCRNMDDWTENCILLHFMLGQQLELTVSGLKFGVENSTTYNKAKDLIPFRRRVFSLDLDGRPIRGKNVGLLIENDVFKKLDDNDAVSLCCVGILQLVLLGVEDRHVDLGVFSSSMGDYYTRYRRHPRIDAWSSKHKFYRHMLKLMLHGQLPVERLVPDETEARSRWWVSSREHFNGRSFEDEKIPRHLNRNNYFEVSSEMYRELEEQRKGYQQMKEKNDNMYEKCLVDFKAIRVFHLLFIRWQTTTHSLIWKRHQIGKNQIRKIGCLHQISKHLIHRIWVLQIPNPLSRRSLNLCDRAWREPQPSVYMLSPYTVLPPTTVLTKKRIDKTNKKGKTKKLSPLNLGNNFTDETVSVDDVTITGVQQTDNYFSYETVDHDKVTRDAYVPMTEFLIDPYDIYLDCYMKGYKLPSFFWPQLVPHLCTYRRERSWPEGWLSSGHMDSWIQIIIRERTENANWTLAKSCIVCLHQENNRFMILMDPHNNGTFDGSVRPFPSWNDITWVYMPINVGGVHWVTGAINLADSIFYVFDSMESESRVLMHAAIALAVQDEFPLAYHAVCCRHLMMNLSLKRDKTKVLFWRICKAYTTEEFLRSMSHLQDIQTNAYDKLCQVGPQRWSRTHCPLVHYNYLTSNSVESVNACTVVYRKLPVLKLAETYRAMVQEWYYQRRKLTGDIIVKSTFIQAHVNVVNGSFSGYHVVTLYLLQGCNEMTMK